MFVPNFFQDFTYQNYENRLIFDGVIPKNKWRTFSGTRCISSAVYNAQTTRAALAAAAAAV